MHDKLYVKSTILFSMVFKVNSFVFGFGTFHFKSMSQLEIIFWITFVLFFSKFKAHKVTWK